MQDVLSKVTAKPVAVESDVKTKGIKNPACTVIAGFSSRYIYDELMKSDKKVDFVVIVEPDLGIFKATLERVFVGDLIESDRVELLVGCDPEEILPNLYLMFTKPDSNVPSRAMRSQAPEIMIDPFAYPFKEDGTPHPVAKVIAEETTRTSKQVFTAMGCGTDSFSRWEGSIENLETMKNSYMVKGLFNKFDDTDVFVLGAGPSLEDFIKAAKDHKLDKKSLIISCDAALPRLLREGLRPHIVTRCERKLTEIFKGVTSEDTKDIFYAAYPWCSKEFFDLFQENIMLFRDNGLCRWLGFDVGSVNGGVSSANAALELALMFKAKNIYLSGIDLCFMDGKSHLSGTEVEFDIEKSKPKWTKVTNNKGELVDTIPVWKRCHNEYEQAIHKWKAKNVYNLSERGAVINGVPLKSWGEVVETMTTDRHVVERIRKHLEKPSAEAAKAYDEHEAKTISFFKKAREELKKLFPLVEDQALIASRVEQDIVETCKTSPDWRTFFDVCLESSKGLEKPYKDAIHPIDKFRTHWFNTEEFAYSILDTLQADLYMMENRVAKINNSEVPEYKKLKGYLANHTMFLAKCGIYINWLIELLETKKRKKADIGDFA